MSRLRTARRARANQAAARRVPSTSAVGTEGGYAERMRTPWWWYLVAIAVAVVLGAEFAFAVSGWITWVPLLILVPVCVLVVWRLSGGWVAVHGDELVIPEAALSISNIEEIYPLSPTELRRLVGRDSNPSAFVYVRSWVGPGVQLVLRDGSEVPYWVVSTRHPDLLAASVRAAAIRLS